MFSAFLQFVSRFTGLHACLPCPVLQPIWTQNLCVLELQAITFIMAKKQAAAKKIAKVAVKQLTAPSLHEAAPTKKGGGKKLDLVLEGKVARAIKTHFGHLPGELQHHDCKQESRQRHAQRAVVAGSQTDPWHQKEAGACHGHSLLHGRRRSACTLPIQTRTSVIILSSRWAGSVQHAQWRGMPTPRCGGWTLMQRSIRKNW